MDYWFSAYWLITAAICVYGSWLDIKYRHINHICWILLGILGLTFGPPQTLWHHFMNAGIPAALLLANRFLPTAAIGTGDLLFMIGCGPHLNQEFMGTFEIVSGLAGLVLAGLFWNPRIPLKNMQIPLVPALGLGLQYCMIQQYW